MYPSKNVAVHTQEAGGPFTERKDEGSVQLLLSKPASTVHDVNVTF